MLNLSICHYHSCRLLLLLLLVIVIVVAIVLMSLSKLHAICNHIKFVTSAANEVEFRVACEVLISHHACTLQHKLQNLFTGQHGFSFSTHENSVHFKYHGGRS